MYIGKNFAAKVQEAFVEFANNTLKIIMIVVFFMSGANASSFCTKSSGRDLDLRCDVDQTDLYIGLGVGHVVSAAKSFNFASSSSTGSFNVLFGKRLSDAFAFETQFMQAGMLYDEVSTNKTEVNVFSFSGIGRFPLDEGHYLSLFGRFGWGVSYVTIQGVGNNWHGDLSYGAGFELGLGSARNWILRLSADEYNTGALSVLVPGQPVPRDKLENINATLLLNF